MAQFRFLKGNYSGLNSVAITEGQLLITKDTRELFVDVDASTRIKIGDFTIIGTLAELEALDATSVPTSRLYYVEDVNIFCKSNGATWTQINKDTGATSVEVVGSGNAVTDASYDPTTRKLTLTRGETFATKAEHDELTEYVGTFTHDTAKTVVEYINAKTDGIATSGNLEALAGRVTAAEGEINALQEAIAEGGSVANAIADAKKAGTDAKTAADAAQATADEKTTMAEVEAKNYATKTEAQGYANAKDEAIATAQAKADSAYELAEGKVTMTEVNNAIAGAGHAVKSEVDEALALKADKSAVEAMYTNDQIDAFVQAAKDYADANDADTKYGIVYDSDNKKIKLVEGGSEVEIDASAFIKDGMINTVTIDENDDLIITFNTDAGKENIVLPLDQLVDIYTGVEGARVKVTVASDKSISADLVAGSISKNYLDDGVQASLAKADSAETNAKVYTDAEVAKLAQADTDNLAAAKKYTDDEIAELNIADYVKKADADAAYAPADHNHDDDYDAKGAAAQALVDAKAYADTAETDAVNTAKAYTDELANGQVKANTEAIATKAAQTDLDGAVTRIGTAEGKISALETASATHALKTEVETVQTNLDEYEEANNTAVALKANAADVYTKTEVYTKAEVDTAVAVATEWGSF